MYQISGRFLLSGSSQNVEWNRILQLDIFAYLTNVDVGKFTYLLATKPYYSLQSATKQQHK